MFLLCLKKICLKIHFFGEKKSKTFLFFPETSLDSFGKKNPNSSPFCALSSSQTQESFPALLAAAGREGGEILFFIGEGEFCGSSYFGILVLTTQICEVFLSKQGKDKKSEEGFGARKILLEVF